MKLSLCKWCIDVTTDKGYTLAFNWNWNRRMSWVEYKNWWNLGWTFGYSELWYDGPHKSFNIGPFNVYWNWGGMKDGYFTR